jgi:hypothetical protein
LIESVGVNERLVSEGVLRFEQDPPSGVNPITTVGILPSIGCSRNLLRVALPKRHREGKDAVPPAMSYPVRAERSRAWTVRRC